MDNRLTISLTELGKLIDEILEERQLSALRSELITAHGEAEERMRERDSAREATKNAHYWNTQLSATLARKQRVIDEAKSILLCAHFNYTTIENRADHLTDSAKSALAVLRPESTPPVPASPVGKQPTEPSPVGKASPTIETVAEYLKSGEPGNPSEFPKSSMSNPQRQWSSKRPRTPACYSKWWQAWMNGDRREIIVRDAEMFRVYHNDSDWAECSLWLPWQEGDTKDNLPPLPNAEYMASGEVPGANLSALLAFKSSLSEASAIVAEWPAWKRDILKGVRETLESVPDDARGGAE
jgi:hypothetical protein